MELTPNDIRNYEFPTQLRGYDKEEVDNFTEQVAVALEQAKQESLKLSMELEAIKGQLTSLKQFEDTIKGAAIDARRNADATVAAAKAEAQKIIAQARAEADQVLTARSEQIAELENQMAKLEMTRKSYVKKLRSTIESHLEIIDEIISEEAVVQAETKVRNQRRKTEIEVVESSEVSADARETVATPPSPEPGIDTEEANAPEEVGREGEPAAETSDGATAEVEPKPIDPEIAQALQQYQHEVAEESVAAAETPIAPRVPKPGEIVETSARAEDIPSEFIAVDAEQDASQESTDKVKVSEPVADHQAIKLNEPSEKQAKPPAEELTEALDEVVAKFEEELDKAAKR